MTSPGAWACATWRTARVPRGAGMSCRIPAYLAGLDRFRQGRQDSSRSLEAGDSSPSVILSRHGVERRIEPQAALLLTRSEPQAGSVVVIEPGRIRIRRLPIS